MWSIADGAVGRAVEPELVSQPFEDSRLLTRAEVEIAAEDQR